MKARDLLVSQSLAFAWVAAFPRLSHRMRWPSRLGVRGTAAYVGWMVLLRVWIEYRVRRYLVRYEEVMADLRRDLGREPTSEEVTDEMVRRVGG